VANATRIMLVAVVAVARFGELPARAEGPFQDALIQPPNIAQPQRGSLVGTLSRIAFGAGDLDRGVFTLPLPIDVRTDRGPLLAKVVPAYSPESGIGEWGHGWQGWRRYHHRAPDRGSMILTPLETRVLCVIAMCRGLVPQEQLDEMDQLARAGEPGVALENLATQLYEYDVTVEQGTLEEFETLSKVMGLDPKYWARLVRV
jgi:hypothetical protein